MFFIYFVVVYVVGLVVVVFIGLVVWYNFKCFVGWERLKRLDFIFKINIGSDLELF